MSTATELSESLAAAVERAGPSVVRVEGRHRASSSGIVWSADGKIATAAHTVEREEGITVGLADGQELEAKLVGRDPSTDVAVLEVKASGLAPMAWLEAEKLKVGHLALAVARPGRSARAALGIITTLGPADEPFRIPGGSKLARYVQTDIGPRVGFSGGAAVDASGVAFGLHTTGVMRGASLAVPHATVKHAVESILAHGGVRRGFLGVGTYPVPLPEALEKQLGQGSALLVVSVAPKSPAEKSGILLGDLVVALDGQPLRHVGDLLGLLDEERIGKDLPLRIVRGGETRDVNVNVGARS